MFFSNIKSRSSLLHRSLSRFVKGTVMTALVAISVSLISSCDNGLGVYDDLDECPRGVIMRFVFNYNLEFANAFPNQVDCLSVYLFDEQGNLVERRTETTEVLADEDYRMTFDLPAGNYQVVAYGGMECDMTSFSHTKAVEDIKTIDDLEVLINEEHIGDMSARPSRKLHDLYHGYHSFTVHEGITYDKETVEMMRDTNHIRLVLQHIDGTPVNVNDFRFEIVDDNVKFNYKNDVLSHKTVNYSPWTTGVSSPGDVLKPELVKTRDVVINTDPQVAYAELSVSRLMYRSAFTWANKDGKVQMGPRLRISLSNGDTTIAELPLIEYLLYMKNGYYADMGNQEYLDRCSRYNMVFFLGENNAWVRTNIIVENWTVRIDNISY